MENFNLFDFVDSDTDKTSPTKKDRTMLHKLIVCLFVLLFMSASPRLLAQTISGSTVVCANSSQMYTTSYTSGYTYLWNVIGAAANTPNSNSLTVTYGLPPTGGGNALITLTVLDGNGTTVGTASLVVHINPTPQPDIVPLSSMGCSYPPPRYDGTVAIKDDQEHCNKVCDSTIFKYQPGNFDPNHIYNWSVIPASAAVGITVSPSTGEAEVYWGAASGSNQYSLRLTEIDPLTGCSDSIDMCIKIIARPNASFSVFPAPDMSGVVHICFNSTVAFFDQSTADPNSMIASYLWDFGDGGYSTQQFPTHTYASAGTYIAKLIVENQCHCKDSMYVTVEVDGQPGADIYCVSPRCYNTSDTYCTSWSCSPFNWSVTNGTITSIIPYSNCIDITWGTNGAGSIIFTPDPSCGGCPYPTSVLVPVLTPSATITGANPACEKAISLYNVPNIPATTYNWQLIPAGSGIIMSGQGTNQVSVYFGAALINCTLQVIYSNTFLHCSGGAELPILVAPRMTLVGDSIICASATGNYASNSSSANWWVEDAAGGTTALGSGVNSVSYTFPAAGAYVVYAQDLTGNFCSSPQAYQVQVIAQPPQPAVSINTDICQNSVSQYFGMPTSSNNYYLHWDVTGGVPSQGAGNSISVTWTATAGTISLTQVQTMPPSCASIPLVFNMSTPAVPPPTINTSNSNPCFNQSVNYSTPSAADGYTWQIAPSTIGSIAQGAGTGNITIQYNNGTSPQTAFILLIVERCGTTNSTVLTVTVGVPNAPAIVVPNICQNQPATFGASPSPSGSYAWTFGDGGTGSGSSPAHTYSTVSPYVVNLTVTNPNGCIGTVSTSTLINVKPSPVANITSPDQLSGACPTAQPFPYTLFASAQTISGTPVYAWNLNGSPYAGNVTNTTITQAGLYSMSVTIGGCTATTAVNVTTNCGQPNPCTNNSVTVTHTLSCTTATFNGIPTGSGGSITNWAFPDGSNSSAQNPVFTFSASGYYHVYVTAVWNGTCQAIFDYVIAVPIEAGFKYNLSCGSPSLNVSFIDQSNWIPSTTVTYTWNVIPSVALSPNSNAQNPTATNMGGTYTVQQTIAGSGQTCVETQTIVIPQIPVAGFTATNSVCEGNVVIFNNTSSPTSGIRSYFWDFGDPSPGLITYNNSIPNGANGVRAYDYDPSTPFYPASLTIQDVYGCQSTYSPVVIQLHQDLFPSNLATITTTTLSQICNGSSTIICASSTNPNTPLSYLWSDFSTGSCISASLAGTYYVQITDKWGCKSNKPTAYVNVIAVPPPIVSGRQSYCEGETPVLSIDKGTGYTYQWIYATTDPNMISATGSYTSTACTNPLFPPTPSSCALSPALNTNPTGTLSLGGLITETSSGLNCQAQWSAVTITIHPLPPPPSVGSDACETEGLIPLTATPSGTGVVSSIMWNTGQQGSPIYVVPAGKYWASVVDNYGCVSKADTAHIWSLPDFNSVLYGCYDICDTGNISIPVPFYNSDSYYTAYTWIKQGVGVVAGTNPYPTPLNLTNPSSMPDGTNAGVYQLILQTNHGCTDTSKTLELSVVHCATCKVGTFRFMVDNVYCMQDPITGTTSYYYQFNMFNSTGTSVNFSLTSGNGVLNLSPPVSVLNPGSNILTGNFVPIAGATNMCMHFAIQDPDNIEQVCGMDTCIALPECRTKPCGLEDMQLNIECVDVKNGMPIYKYGLNFNYSGNTGTVIINTSEGYVDQGTNIVNPGGNSISGTFTDTPVFDGVLCLTIYIQSVDDDGNIIWCQDEICAPLPLKDPCLPSLPNCNLRITPQISACYSVNILGQISYSVVYDITNLTGITYTYYLMSADGIVSGTSSQYINPSSTATHGSSLLQVMPLDPSNPQQCFKLVATDINTGHQCVSKFCIKPQDCDPSQLRLISTAEVNLYPNPTEDYTTAEYVLDNKGVANKFCLIDLNGRIVQEIQLNDTKGKAEINTSSLKAGMYFLKAMNGNQTVLVKKLIIQR